MNVGKLKLFSFIVVIFFLNSCKEESLTGAKWEGTEMNNRISYFAEFLNKEQFCLIKISADKMEYPYDTEYFNYSYNHPVIEFEEMTGFRNNGVARIVGDTTIIFTDKGGKFVLRKVNKFTYEKEKFEDAVDLHKSILILNPKFTASYSEFIGELTDEEKLKRLYSNIPKYFRNFSQSYDDLKKLSKKLFENNREKLYQVLRKFDSSFTSTYNEFVSDIQDENKRIKLYLNIRNEFSDAGDYDYFCSKMGFPIISLREDLYNYLINSGLLTEEHIGNKKMFLNRVNSVEKASLLYDNLIKSKLVNESHIGTRDAFLKSISPDFRLFSSNGQTHNVPVDQISYFLSKRKDVQLIDDCISRKYPTGVKPEDVDIDKPLSSDTRLKTGDSPYNSYFGKGIRNRGSLSEITVKNGTNQDAIVVFINVYTDKCMRNVYIRANSNYTIKQIPEGTYKMKCFYGNDWDSSLNNGVGFPVGGFRRNVSFTTPSSNKDYFDTHKEEINEGYNYPTYTVTLHKVINGNMHTKDISKSDFFN
jgi:hypothetical protein